MIVPALTDALLDALAAALRPPPPADDGETPANALTIGGEALTLGGQTLTIS